MLDNTPSPSRPLGVLLDGIEAIERTERVLAALKFGLIELARQATIGGEIADEVEPRARHAADVAERSLRAELALLQQVPDRAAENQMGRARVLLEMQPRCLAALSEGRIGQRQALVLSDLLPLCPEGLREEIEERALAVAPSVTPSQLERRIRRWIEEADPEGAGQRRAIAVRARGVWHTPLPDGMGLIEAVLSAEDAVAIHHRVSALALSAADGPDEPRSREARRADVFSELLLYGEAPQLPKGVRASVSVTVPALALISGHGLGELHGHGPIDIDTARRIAATAPTFVRILTDPHDGAVLGVSRSSYRPPADLVRAVRVRDRTCRFPGCQRPADQCEIDHVAPAASGGPTRHDNLIALCQKHHTLKHSPGWAVRIDGATRRWAALRWSTPSRREYAPPPPDPVPG